MNYKVVEKFVSVNGEGRLSGQLAIFIRFAGCNLDCSYCDTRWANEENVEYTLMNEQEIYEYIQSTGVKNITLTGGEPLLQVGLIELLNVLSKDEDLLVEIETNGSVSLKEFIDITNAPRFVMDYKLPSSDMEEKMLVDNLKYLTKKDTIKFVAGTTEDLERAKYLIDEYNLINKTNVYISPVFGKIEMAEIVEFMHKYTMNGVTLQVQLHKIIWDPEERGV
ncbi:putative 7-carboxy-7-deazaguanine synthase QueE [Oceanirhabdus sp. W0125-5]|uniref:putative 7-carboxy-7-deazaguanine synthase QueE n=1 Tax=Oceanirhabdus sp. W0125-5 TaxID=2999116 RepID=UPI0022F31946|nr:putative 7-carboxy-7-deazaguanine synthase QueE [Oceanirhabdus sp. W0125-5]WBW97218.1 putative 7-carboxy-7-deazaguanine synthase QueE [Oceanirhabdus sp. W0125-5]